MFDVLEPSVALIATFYLRGNRSIISEMGPGRVETQSLLWFPC
jgi:hypothetical protein